MTRSYMGQSTHSDAQRRDERGARHTAAGGHNFTSRPDAPNIIGARTRYPHMLVTDDYQPLKSGYNNTKIGKTVTKGRLKGAPIMTLTLEERDTCPSSCRHWFDCFGNRMNFARRQAPGPMLERYLQSQLGAFEHLHPRGFLVRLHVLGDFYSVDYVLKWRKWMDSFTALNVYGYTAWAPSTPIGEEVKSLADDYGPRFAMRWSDRGDIWATRATITVKDEKAERGDAIVCPAQTGKTDCCATCALCWQTTRNIAFIAH